MADILGDLTFDDVEKANPDNDRLGKNTSSFDLNSIHIAQIFCEFQKGKNILRFALVRFGEYERYDIRSWYDQGTKPGKGFAMTYEELKTLREDLRNVDLERLSLAEKARFRGNKVSAIVYNRISLLSEFKNKGEPWSKEVTVVDWGYGPKVDFRKWKNDYSACGKGISVSFDETSKIIDLMYQIQM